MRQPTECEYFWDTDAQQERSLVSMWQLVAVTAELK